MTGNHSSLFCAAVVLACGPPDVARAIDPREGDEGAVAPSDAGSVGDATPQIDARADAEPPTRPDAGRPLEGLLDTRWYGPCGIVTRTPSVQVVTTFEISPNGRLDSEMHQVRYVSPAPPGRRDVDYSVTYEYGDQGRLIGVRGLEISDGATREDRVTFEYDDLGRLQREIRPGAGSLEYGYAAALLSRVTDSDGYVVAYQHDTAGRLVREVHTFEASEVRRGEYAYAADGWLSTAAWYIDGELDITASYECADGFVQRVRDYFPPRHPDLTAAANVTFHYGPGNVLESVSGRRPEGWDFLISYTYDEVTGRIANVRLQDDVVERVREYDWSCLPVDHAPVPEPIDIRFRHALPGVFPTDTSVYPPHHELTRLATRCSVYNQ